MQVDYTLIKESTRNTLDRYVNNHIPTGGFLKAVLENDLFEAFSRVDEENCATMFHICAFIWNEIPRECWGSPEKVKAWLALRQQS